MKKILYFLSMVLLLSATKSVYAQGGCVNSPENPTAILLLIGSSGFVATARRRFFK